MNIRDLIRSVDGGGDEAVVAEIVLRKVLTDHTLDEQIAILLPVIRSEVHHLRRNRERRREDLAFTEGPDDLSALRRLRNEPFTDVISHASITWSEATRKQHLARARWLRRSHIQPTQQTVQRHEAAARLIADRHVQRLADLAEFQQAA